ncbi:MAG: PilZ domain-containing protein [Pseudomonadota bacterium]|nr:PilZ domain-containing protein [Pseudomonadota bacterium]
MAEETGRRFGRWPIRIPAVLIVGRKQLDVLTEDVSRSGLRVQTDAPPGERQLVQLRLALPPEGLLATLCGITAHAVKPGATRAPGVGVQLYGNGPDVLARWEQFLRYVELKHVDAQAAGASGGESPGHASAPPAADPIRRRFERVHAVLEVRFRSVDELLPLLTRDASKGGLFVTTEHPREVGEELGLEVVHPATQATFPLRGVVRRVVRDRALGMGMGLEFLDVDDASREAFWDFVTTGLPSLAAEDMEALDEPAPESTDEDAFTVDFSDIDFSEVDFSDVD